MWTYLSVQYQDAFHNSVCLSVKRSTRMFVLECRDMYLKPQVWDEASARNIKSSCIYCSYSYTHALIAKNLPSYTSMHVNTNIQAFGICISNAYAYGSIADKLPSHMHESVCIHTSMHVAATHTKSCSFYVHTS